MKSFFLILSFFSLLPFFSGCTVTSEGCSSDSECRFGRICQESICVGEIDITINNGISNNGTNNNGLNNGANNGSNNFNNGENNGSNNINNGENNGQNNGDSCGGCPGNAICEDGQCIEFCDANTDCPPEEACSARFEAPGNQCVDADACVLEQYFVEEFEFCEVAFGCDGFNYMQCAFADEDTAFCNCETEFQSAGFETSADACFDLERLIDLINQNCGTRIRTPLAVPG